VADEIEVFDDKRDLGPRPDRPRVRSELTMSFVRGRGPGDYRSVCGGKNPVGGRCMAPLQYVLEIECPEGHLQARPCCLRHAAIVVDVLAKEKVGCEVCADFAIDNPVQLHGDSLVFAADLNEFRRNGRPLTSQLPIHEGSDSCWDCYAAMPDQYAQFPTVCRHRMPPVPPL